MQHAGVDRSRDQVVGRSDGMDIACEVKVEVLHRDHLAVAAAGRSALDPEGRSLAGLADTGYGALSQHPQPLRQAHSGGGLTFAKGRGSDGGHIDILALGAVLELLKDVEMDLRLVFAIGLDVILAEAQLGNDLRDGLELGGLGDVQVAGDGRQTLHRVNLRVSAVWISRSRGKTLGGCQERGPRWLS